MCKSYHMFFHIQTIQLYRDSLLYKPISAFDRKTLTLHVTKLDLGNTFVLHWTKKMQGDLLF